MNTFTQNWIGACLDSEIPKRGAIRIQHGERQIAIFKTASGDIFALEDKCPHNGGPLSAGIVHDNCVTCPLHNWDISLKSGMAQGADEGQATTFSVRLEGDRVMLCIDEIRHDLTA